MTAVWLGTTRRPSRCPPLLIRPPAERRHGPSCIDRVNLFSVKAQIFTDHPGGGEALLENLPAAPAPQALHLSYSLERFGLTPPDLLVGDLFELVPEGALDDTHVGVWYYDAAHDYDSQVEGLRIAEPLLVPGALLIVDDTDWADVERALDDFETDEIEQQVRCEVATRRDHVLGELGDAERPADLAMHLPVRVPIDADAIRRAVVCADETIAHVHARLRQ